MRIGGSRNLIKIIKRNVSALYIPGDKAKDTYAVLVPYLDFEKKFENAEELKRNISVRRMNISFDAVHDIYNVFSNLRDQRIKLEERRLEIASELKNSGQDGDPVRLDTLKDEGRKVRDDWKAVKEKLYSVEDSFVHNFLSLPNKLHEKTPLTEGEVRYEHDISIAKSSKGHLAHTDKIVFKNVNCFYLKEEAAEFDMEMPLRITEKLVQNKFIQFSNPDFSRSLLVEAATIDEGKLFEIEEEHVNEPINRLHLVGGASLVSFLGFLAKLTVFPSLLPLRLVASGKQYERKSEGQERGLYSVLQSNIVQTLCATENDELANIEFEHQLNLIVEIYKEFNLNFRIVLEPARNLLPAESLRASVQIFSPVLNEYVEVAHLSNYSDFISKRILFNYKVQKDYKFPSIIAGKVFDSVKMIAILLENNKPLTLA